jgi:hypothetical protein
MQRIPNTKILQGLCILTAILWSILLILSISKGSNYLIPIAMLGSIILEIIFFFLLKRKLKIILSAFITFTLLNLILTITDQMGIWDYILLSIYVTKIVISSIYFKYF